MAKIEKSITIDRAELIEILERKFNVKFGMNKLSSTGFKGWIK